MDSKVTQQLLKQKKTQYVKLVEVSDITHQLADAVEHNDDVSIKITLSMRQDPLLRLQEMDEHISEFLERLPQQDAIRYNGILNGAPAQSEEEKPLCDQVAQNSRLLRQIREMDKAISEKIDKKKSFYNKFR